jgi:hypothetical protein
MLDPTTNWIVALFIGAAMVTFTFWFQFDEPSYDSSSEFFSKYKPRFSTSHSQYARAKYQYVLLFVAVYLVFSFVPDIFYTLVRGGDSKLLSPTVVPVLAALALITVHKNPLTKDVERRIRIFFHALAQIPEGVRRTVAQIRDSDLSMDRGAVSAQTIKLGTSQGFGPDTILNLIRDDQITGLWYRAGHVLSALAESKRKQDGIDLLFFESFKDELEAITSQHTQIAEFVRRHIDAVLGNPSLLRPGVVNDNDGPVYSELSKLRERLYTFVACGVRFSFNTAIEHNRILKNLGFVRQYSPPPKGDIFAIIGLTGGLSFMAIMIVSVFTGFLTGIFRAKVLAPLGDTWSKAFPIPKELLDIYLWSWTTALVYASAIIGAIIVRELRITERRWFDINELSRDRPILKYIIPAFVGAFCGCVTLFVIAVANGPGFHVDGLPQAVRLALPWFPLPLAIAVISLVLVDSNMVAGRELPIIGRSLCGGLFMAFIGFLTSYLSISISVGALAEQLKLDPTLPVSRAVVYASLFISLLIAIFATVLCFIVQAAEWYIEKARRLAGVFAVIPVEGSPVSILLDDTGSASWFPAEQEQISRENIISRGKWVQFPEGTVVRWSNSGDKHASLADMGIISVSDEYLVYQGYRGRIQGDPMIVGHLDRRADLNAAA